VWVFDRAQVINQVIAGRSFGSSLLAPDHFDLVVLGMPEAHVQGLTTLDTD
jgi:hypothetical protein